MDNTMQPIPNDKSQMTTDPQVQDDQVVVQTPVAPVQDDTQQQTPPVQPIAPVSPSLGGPTGSMHKEAGPVGPAVEYSMTPSSPTETAPVLDQEVQEAGVEHAVDSTELQLNQEHANAGIAPAKESVPVLQAQPIPAAVQIQNAPFTETEATEIIKTTPTDDTKHWLAVLFLMVSKKMHLTTV